MIDWTTLSATAGSVVVAVVGSQALNTWIAGRASKKKTDADAASQLAATMLTWQKTLTDRITVLEAAITQCHLEHMQKDEIITDLKARVTTLEAGIRS